MTFSEENIIEFHTIFNEVYPKIVLCEGCSELKVLKDVDENNILYTLSFWESNVHLQNYRNSDLFRSTWIKVKKLFIADPVAWSMEQISNSS